MTIFATPIFQPVAHSIAYAIECGRFEPGLVLLESHLSACLGTSRANVRSALIDLAGKDYVHRFEGRGFVVRGGSAPVRRQVTSADVSMRLATAINAGSPIDRIVGRVNEELGVAVIFGHFRINEQILADQNDVSRPVAREVLWRLRDSGLVEKQHNGSWTVGPITARLVADQCELLALTEPYVLRSSARGVSQGELQAMRTRIVAARSEKSSVEHSVVDAIEHDLHTTCLSLEQNSLLKRILKEGELPRRVNVFFARLVGVSGTDPSFLEHLQVIDALLSGDVEKAADLHTGHLLAEARRTLDRLKVLSIIQEPVMPNYLERIV